MRRLALGLVVVLSGTSDIREMRLIVVIEVFVTALEAFWERFGVSVYKSGRHLRYRSCNVRSNAPLGIELPTLLHLSSFAVACSWIRTSDTWSSKALWTYGNLTTCTWCVGEQ